ncbi:hypothetical protein GCM10009578_067610 [Streptomyces rhizosphaericus]|uniref:Uncharacterized protein n=1 Tax=Streptomyces rhizosphaericus TaxID=114699 RepID=A0ABN1R254_9ACTN
MPEAMPGRGRNPRRNPGPGAGAEPRAQAGTPDPGPSRTPDPGPSRNPGPGQGRSPLPPDPPVKATAYPQLRAPVCSATAVFAPSVAVNWPEESTVTDLPLWTSQ